MMKIKIAAALSLGIFSALTLPSHAIEYKDLTFKAGHPSLADWILPEKPPMPENNRTTNARITLGKTLFFDPRLSGDGEISCASCHNPLFGWSDGLPAARGYKGKQLGRGAPAITNAGYNKIQMWDGRKKSLEDQVLGPLLAADEMHGDMPKLLAFLRGNSQYVRMFDQAYPTEAIDESSLARAIAAFERTVISRNSDFDRWVSGDTSALSKQQISGFKLFVNPHKGNCAVCHSGANFTDDGFHNLGLASYGDKQPDLGRYNQRPLKLMKGAFKTPTIRDITLTAPYFHDGSAKSLLDVVRHYQDGGVVKTNLSPNFKAANLSEQEVIDVIAFIEALTSPRQAFELPVLPLSN